MTNVERTSFSIRNMSSGDIEPALGLCRAAGWNQLRQDWQRLIDYEPSGCFVAMCEGQLAGTVTTTRYGSELGWIGMMLVDPDFRRQGIATALIQQSVDYLKTNQVRCIKLDATPVGEKVYQRLGFEAEWSFHRWSCQSSTGAARTDGTATSRHLPDSAMELDRDAFGVDRSEFLNLLGDGSFIHVMPDGYGMLRPGVLASYLGPISATSPKAAECIITELLQRAGGITFWDVPAPNTAAIQIARSLGFAPVRDLTRMSYHGVCFSPNLRLQYALAGPGTG